MIGMEILNPVGAWALWTMVLWAGLSATRIPAMQAAGIDPAAGRAG